MRVGDIRSERCGASWVSSALVVWEECDHAEFRLTFEVDGTDDVSVGAVDALATALFPLAVVYRERRLRLDGDLCPMLADGLRAMLAWWRRWGGTPAPEPAIEVAGPRLTWRRGTPTALSLMSGGVDSLHTLYRNRQLYRPGDPAFIGTVVFVHGYDIGRRARDPEHARFRMVHDNLTGLTAMADARLLSCRTNLRHLPAPPGFWAFRHSGPGLAAVGHAAAANPGFVFIAGAYDVPNLMPMGCHAAVDPCFSSQDLAIRSDGATFSRLDKLRELIGWPEALNRVRVCPANVGMALNCGTCAACIHTRLELFALGVDYTDALGTSLVDPDLLEAHAGIEFVHEAVRYQEILELLEPRGVPRHCRIIAAKLARYDAQGPRFWSAPGVAAPVAALHQSGKSSWRS